MRVTFITNPHSCNLNCELCFSKQAPIDWEKTQEMDFAIIEKVVKAFPNLTEIIPSTIGEPFLYSNFENFLSLAKINKLKVNIITNGTFPNGGIEKWVPLLLPVLSDIKFSAMNGEMPNWLKQNILTFILKKRESGFKPTISIQATIKNDENREVKIAELQKFADYSGVDRIKVNDIWKIQTQNSQLNATLGDSGGAAAGNDYECSFLGKEAWVWVDGAFQACPNPDARFGMRSKFPFGDFGNFAADDPLEIWNGARYKKFCETYKENAICQKCKMRLNAQLKSPAEKI